MARLLCLATAESDVSYKKPGDFSKRQWLHEGTDIVEWASRMEWFILQIRGRKFGTFGQKGVGLDNVLL